MNDRPPLSPAELGEEVRRAVLGDAHVDAARQRTTEFDRGFQQWLTQTAWAGVWADETIDRRTRSLVTVAILAALRSDEFALHLRAARTNGATTDEIAAVLMHVGVYAGIPAANSAFAIAKPIVAEWT